MISELTAAMWELSFSVDFPNWENESWVEMRVIGFDFYSQELSFSFYYEMRGKVGKSNLAARTFEGLATLIM